MILIGVIVFDLMITICYSVFVYATNPEVDQVNITVPVSCTMDGSGMNSHTANIDNNNYETEIGSTTITTYCNDTNGFSIYAIGYSNDEYGNTDMIGTSTEELIHTGTTLDGTTSNWAMKLSTDPNATYPVEIQNSYNNYKVVPTTYTLVAKRESSTDLGTAAIGSILTTTYAASVSPTQVADTYIGKVRYTLVHPYNEIPPTEQATDPGKICYYPNTAIYEGTMGCQTLSAGTADVTLLASNFSKDGYGFAGWSDVPDYTTNTNAKFYGPQEDITFTEGQYSGTNPGLSLYAVWIPSAGHFQDSGRVAELCGTGANALIQAPTDGTANLSSVSALTDLRDNQTYAIAKLADGNCWMIENLGLEAIATRGSANENLSQGYGKSAGYGNFSGLADAENTGFSLTYSANSLYSNNGSNNTISVGTSNSPACRMPRYNNLNTPENATNRPENPTSSLFNDDNITVGMYSYGNYYTWSAALANTIVYNGPTSTDIDDKTSENVGTSICPNGWKLPYGRSIGNGAISGGFSYLDIQLGGTGEYQSVVNASDEWRTYPNNFIFSGGFSMSSAVNRGEAGLYWTSTAGNGGNSYYLYLGDTDIDPGTSFFGKYHGFAVRCLVSET